MSELLIPPQADIAQPEALRNEVPFENLHKKEFVIGMASSSIYNPTEIGLPDNGEYAVLAEMQLGETDNTGSIAVIRQSVEGKHNVMLVGLSKDPTDPNASLKVSGNICELRESYPVHIGRTQEATGNTPDADDFVTNLELHTDNYVSRNHATVSYENGLITIADISSNGTKLRAGGYKRSLDSHERQHTSRAEDQARLQGYLLETIEGKRFDGRVPIGRDTTVDGADAYVDIRSWVAGGEAIVVDSKKYPQEFNQLLTNYNTAVSELAKQGIGGEAAKLQAIFNTVKASMKYDLDFVNDQSDSMVDNPKRKVSLNFYLNEGKGVCRHMALAAAWLGGELARHGVIEGKTTAEVNQRTKDNAAHEWARYTSKDGTVYIIDPAQNYFGTLGASLTTHGSWEYFRPGERMKYEMLEQDKNARGGDVALSGISKFISRLRKK